MTTTVYYNTTTYLTKTKTPLPPKPTTVYPVHPPPAASQRLLLLLLSTLRSHLPRRLLSTLRPHLPRRLLFTLRLHLLLLLLFTARPHLLLLLLPTVRQHLPGSSCVHSSCTSPGPDLPCFDSRTCPEHACAGSFQPCCFHSRCPGVHWCGKLEQGLRCFRRCRCSRRLGISSALDLYF